MLEAANADLVSPSAWSAAPKSSAIHKLPADYPIYWTRADILRKLGNVGFWPNQRYAL